MQRVFFDSNTGDPESGYLLVFDQSLADIERLGDHARDGEIVLLYMPGELEVKAKLEYDSDTRCWRAFPLKPLDFRVLPEARGDGDK